MPLQRQFRAELDSAPCRLAVGSNPLKSRSGAGCLLLNHRSHAQRGASGSVWSHSTWRARPLHLH